MIRAGTTPGTMPGAATGFGPGTGANPAPDAKQAGARAELALEGHAAPVANARRTPVRPGAPVVLEVRGLAKNFEMRHQGQRLDAFTGVGFSLHAGEFLLLRGPNGAGKSTLLRTIYRSYLPAAGEVILHTAGGPVDLARAADVDISLLRRREIGFVTQFLIARPRVYAEETVAEPLLLAGAGQAEALRAARAALAEFGVKPDLWRAYPTTFPGGEQQKVNLARALILPQRLLMLDEPTASLDAGARAALVRRLGEMKAAGVAMIGVFQHPADVAGLIDGEVELKPTRLADDHAE